jgi:hypothetical protein
MTKEHDQSSSEIIKFSIGNWHQQILSWRSLGWQLPPEKKIETHVYKI